MKPSGLRRRPQCGDSRAIPTFPPLARCRWVISRAGATSLSEIVATGVAVVAVPYPHAKDDHQRSNARHLAQMGACEILADEDFAKRSQWLADLLENEDRRQSIVDAQKQSKIADVNGRRASEILNSIYKAMQRKASEV